jgi:hypothetical protein
MATTMLFYNLKQLPKQKFNTSFQDPKLYGSSGAPTSQVRAAAMLLLHIVGN